jgi:hypothetical protein
VVEMGVEVPLKKVASLLRELLGRTVKVEPGEPLTIQSDGSHWVAVYSGSDGKTSGVCITDLQFAANASAALCLIPQATAKESVAKGKLDPSLVENLKEIMNVCSQLFVANDSGRISLQAVSLAGQCSEETKSIVPSSPQKLGMKVSIEGYGDGKMSLFL